MKNKYFLIFLVIVFSLLFGRSDSAVGSGQTNITVTVVANAMTLNYIAGANGTISGTNPQYVSEGDDGTEVIAMPNPGYHFVNWSDGSTTANRTELNVTASATYTASFSINSYTLTYTAGANGTLSGISPQTVNYNASGTAITALPDPGYQFVSWNDGSTQNPRTDSNVHSNLNVIASFSNAATLTYVAGANGTITGTTPQIVLIGGSGTPVTATPDPSYRFVSWSDGILTANRTDTSIASSMTVTANFTINTYTLKYKSADHGSVHGDLNQVVGYGQDGSKVEARPSTGYKFKEWSDGSDENPRKDNNIEADLIVTAEFEKKSYDLTYHNGANGSISGNKDQTVEYGDDGNTVTANPVAGYHFMTWSDNSAENPRKDTNVKEDISVTANFALDNPSVPEPATFTLTYVAGAGGTLSGQANQTVPSGGNGVAVSAIPNTDYHFTGWSDGSSANSRIDSNIQGNLSVTAIFQLNAENTNINPADPISNENNQNETDNEQGDNLDSDEDKQDQTQKEGKAILSKQKENEDEKLEAAPILSIIPKELQTQAELATAVALSTTLLPLFYQIGSLKNMAIFLRTLLLGFLGLTAKATKRKTWGTVYDSATGDPISFVSISVIDAQTGKIKETKLTDKYGSYFFLVPQGEYQLEIKKNGYALDSQGKEAKTHYANVLEDPETKKLIFTEPGIIFYDLRLKSLNPEQKSFKDKKLSYFFFAALFYLGFLMIVAVYLSSPTKLNLFMVFVYIINIVIRNLSYLGTKWGYVYDKQGTKQPFSAISLLDRNTKQLVARTISDEQGRYIFLANSGDYILKTITNVNQFSEKEEELSVTERGVVKKKIVV